MGWRQARRLIQLAVAFGAMCTAGSAGDFAARPLVQVSPISAFSGCTSDDVAQQPGTNFTGSQVEPWLAVNPRNMNNLVGTWQQDRWSNGGARGLVTGVTFDGGATWSPVVMPGITLCSGGSFQRASDPWLSFGPNGTVYHISLAFDVDSGSGALGRNALLVNTSTDGGQTWSAPVPLIDDTGSGFLNDKETITADPTDANLVYAVWDRTPSTVEGEESTGASARATGAENRRLLRLVGPDTSSSRSPAYFTRSTNGGQTWEPAREIFDPGKNRDTIGNQIVVLPDGSLLDVFTVISTNPNRPSRARISFLHSTDKGVTWRPRRRASIRILPRPFVTAVAINDVYDPQGQQPLRTGDVLPAVAVDSINATLYLVWQDARFSNGGDLSQPQRLADEIAFAMSTNGGRSWSRPIKINRTPSDIPLGNRQAFTPAVHVAADGTIAVTYYDFRFNDAGPDLKTDYFIVRCHPSPSAPCSDASNWDDEIRLTAMPFDITRAPNAGGFFVGDYQSLNAAGNNFLAFFSQVSNAEPATVFFGGAQ